MSDPHPELSELKQEVAELWTRFRKEDPIPGDDEGRRALAELNRSLEARRRVLADRRTVLRQMLDVSRRRASRLAPAVRVFGGLVGAVLASVLLGPQVPAVAALTVNLAAPHGAALLTCSLLLLAPSLSRSPPWGRGSG